MNQLTNKAKKLLVDAIRIKVKGGSGGHGLPQFGGIGGKGGDVYLRGSKTIPSLTQLQKKAPFYFEAQDGRPALRTRLLGEPGKDLIIRVPVGVSIEDMDKQLIGDINEPGEQVIVALGGRGGDKFNDNHGFKGQARAIRLDLKTISDAVLVGFPNAGKSSLLRAVSNATPKVANYPFTTLRPYLGVLNFPDYRQITLADLPGLVEGAHKNLGLGHDFLKHMVRTKLLIFLIDINNVDLGPTYARRTPLETLCILNKEIELYDDTILNKPAILVVSKMDSLEDSAEKFEQFKKELRDFKSNPTIVEEAIRPDRIIDFDHIFCISSLLNKNMEEFKETTRAVIDKYAELARKDRLSTYQEIQPLEFNRIIQ